MDWIVKSTQQFFTAFGQLFTTPFFEVGGKSLSLSSIVFLVLLVVIVFFLARILSRWIRRGVLVRLGIDRGNQEAISTVISYLLTALGFVIVLQTAGFNLSSLAVFAGVLGIGIGFGLQTLASNFISGIAILFERPIKVGDFIEVNHLMGTVERISIRSTLIRTLDNVCIIVPNNYFIENSIVNWSYRDPKTRIHLPIGVAYKTDPVVVTEALLEAARMEPRVLTSPSPKVWFMGFGESSLNFELLVWVDDPPEREPIQSALNFLIEHEFRQREIEIPFPQRELHLRNVKELGEAIRQGITTDAVQARALETAATEARKLTTQSTHAWTLRVLLRRVTYFEQCTDLELRELIENGHREFFAQGQIVCQENDPGESFYIILSGSVEVFSQRAGKYITSLHTGDFFGEIALLTGTPRSATVQASEDTILFVIDRSDLQQLLQNHQELAEQIAQKLAERQQVSQELGLVDEALPAGETPFTWIRKRIQTIFGA